VHTIDPAGVHEEGVATGDPADPLDPADPAHAPAVDPAAPPDVIMTDDSAPPADLAPKRRARRTATPSADPL